MTPTAPMGGRPPAGSTVTDPRGRQRPNRPRRRGVAMVEMSVGLILLLALTFAIIEFGQLIMGRQMLTNAARTAARVAAIGVQPATYPDGSASPSPGSAVTTSYLTTWVTKALAASPLTGINPQFYGANADGTANTSVAWNATSFGDGFYVDVKATYVPLFTGNRIYADKKGNTGPMVGALPLRSLVYLRAEANF